MGDSSENVAQVGNLRYVFIVSGCRWRHDNSIETIFLITPAG
jgi:hypothetical protein